MLRQYERRTTIRADERQTFKRECPTCFAKRGEPCEMQGDHELMAHGFHRERWELRHAYQYDYGELVR